MANKFIEKEWIDRQSQNPNRVRMIETGIENVVDLERVEGEITEIGNAFDQTNMNDLELRIKNAFENLDSSDITVLNTNGNFVATKLEGVLNELFQYASNGKTAIANAIRGISSSSTFAVLANAITSGKTAITTAVGTGTSDNTFSDIAGFVTTLKTSLNSTITSLNNIISTGKTSIVNAIGATPGGTPTTSNTFQEMASFISLYKRTYYSTTISTTAFTASNAVVSRHVNVSFGFTPTKIMISNFNADVTKGGTYIGVFSTGLRSNNRPTSVYTYPLWGIDNITSTGFDIWVSAPSGYSIEALATSLNFLYAYS